MDRLNLRSPDELLVAAGLSVIGTDPGWLDPKRAWQTVAPAGVQPDAVIDDSRDGYLDEVNRAWLHLAQSLNVISADRTFLVSVAGTGAFALPWALWTRHAGNAAGGGGPHRCGAQRAGRGG